MKYYKVRKEADGARIMKWSDRYHSLIMTRVLVDGELYTPAEVRDLFDGATIYGARKDQILLDPVEVSRKQTYWFFGARFA